MDQHDQISPPVTRPVRAMRRVVIEDAADDAIRAFREQQQGRALEHARVSQGFDEEISPHAHDARTFRLIVERRALDRLGHSEYVLPKLDEWKFWEKMNDWDSRNALLQDLTDRFRRREATPGEIALLLTVCRGAWRGVAKQLHRYGGVDIDARAEGAARREEASRVNELDRDELDQVMHHALLATLSNCPRPFPRYFFPWLRETLTFRALDHIRGELTEMEGRLPHDGGIRAFLDEVLAVASSRDATALIRRGGPDHESWLRTLDVPSLFELADEYAPYARVRSACERAVERLPDRQRQVIQDHYYNAMTQTQIAQLRGVADSTVRSNHQHALGNLRRDDDLFHVLEAVGVVRDRARRLQLKQRPKAA